MNLHSLLGNTRRADISFHSSGKIDITSRIVKALGIESGDVIDIMAGNGEYYLYVASHASEACGRHEARCYPTKSGSRYFRSYCRRLCSAILKEIGVVTQASFPAGDVLEVNGRKVIPIVTRNNIARND